DVQMPEMDGLEAAAAVRAREKVTGGHVPIVAMTAYAMKGDRERCLEAGMDDYVSKPIEPNELWRALEKVVPSGDGESEAPAEASAGAWSGDHAPALSGDHAPALGNAPASGNAQGAGARSPDHALAPGSADSSPSRTADGPGEVLDRTQ